MPTDHIVALLLAERARLDRAIEALQGSTARRGRPPADVTAAAAPAKAKARKKRVFTAKQRKEQAARMKAYWAAKRKAAK